MVSKQNKVQLQEVGEGVMNTVKHNKGGKLNISSATKSVPAPAGYHWMVDRGRYFLMKGDYAPHPGAVKEAKFKLVSHGSKEA